jgi:hypothetical protein
MKSRKLLKVHSNHEVSGRHTETVARPTFPGKVRNAWNLQHLKYAKVKLMSIKSTLVRSPHRPTGDLLSESSHLSASTLDRAES